MPIDERPVLRPGSVLLHRSGRPGVASIQLGLDPGTAVRLDVPARSCDAVLARLDGTLTTAQVLAAAVARGADPAVATALLDRLRAAGVLVDARTWLAWTHGWDPAERARRLPDLHAWDRYADAAEVVRRRAAATVRVIGHGRIGTAVAQLLTAAGVGRIGTGEQVAVWCGETCEPDRDDVADLMRAGTPHLLVRVRETTGSVGPFVLPGDSAFLASVASV